MASMTFAAWVAVASAVASAVTMAITLSQGKPSMNSSDQGALLQKKGVDNPRLVAFGNCLVPASVVYKNVRNSDRKWMMQVHSLGHGVFRKVKQVYIDEQPIFADLLGNDLAEQWHTSPIEGFRNVQVGIRRGNYNNQVWPQIVANGDGEWTDAMKGNSIASLQFLVERPDTRGAKDQEYRIMGTQFQSSALVEGIAVIDPVLDPMLLGIHDVSKRVWMNGTKEAYRNPVLQLLTYLLDPMYGAQLKPSMVNLQTFINSMNWCYQNGMVGDGYINQNDTYQKIIEGFANSWGGIIYLENGKICCAPETVGPVVETINESDLIDDLDISNDRGDYVNLVKVEWQDKDTQYNKNTFIIPNNINTDPTIQEDGRVFETSIEVPMSTDKEYIKRFANRELKRSRLCRKQAVFIINNLDKHLKINDVFVINNDLYNLDSNTKWRVQKIESSLDDKVLQSKITAIQYDARVYDTSDYKDSVVGGDLGRPNLNILPPTDLKFVQNTTTDIGSGLFSFESQYYGEQTFRIQYKLSSSTEWTQYGEFPFSNVMITGLQSGTNYDFRVQCAATIGSSRWSELKNQRVNKNISLPAVKNLVGNFTSANAVWTWDAINEPIVNNSVVANTYTNLSELVHYYEVSILHGITTKKTYRTTTPNFTYLFDENSKNGLSRDVTARITPVSIYGDRGQETSLKLFNEPIGQPSSVLVESQLVNLTVSWLNPSNLVPDYDSTDIWITDTKVSPTAADFVATSDIGSWTAVRQSGKKKGWVYVAHRDVFGHPAIPVYSAPIYFEETSIDDLITDSAFEGQFKDLQDSVNQIDTELTELGKEVDANKVEVGTALTNQQNQINAEKDRLNGTIADLAETEAGLNQAKLDILKNSTDIKTNKTELTSQGARLTTVEQVASDNTGSIATVSQRVEAVNKDLSAKIETNRQSIVTTNAAMASMETRLKADIGKNTAAITQTNKTVATLDSTVASMDTRLTAKIDKNTADISTVQQSVADTNGSMASMETKLQAQIDTNKAGIASNKTAIAATDKNLAEYKISVSTEFGKTNGRIDTVSSSVSTLEKTVATQGQTITANYNDLNGKIQTNATVIVDANKAITSLDTKLSAQIKGVDDKANGIRADVTQQGLAIAATDKVLTEFKTSTNAQFGTVNSRIDTVQTNLATTDKALADYKIEANAKIGKNTADIKINATAITTTNTALSTYQTKNDAEVNGLKASVQTISQAQVGTDRKVSAIYGLKVDANGKVAGMTLGATDKGSTVDFLADTFRIASSTNGVAQTAFEVRNGTTYIRNAMIGDLTSTNIRTGSLTGNEIASTGVIRAGSGMNSATLDGASPDWRIYVGNAANPYAAPFRIDKYGNVWADNASIKGNIVATSGSFTGEIYAQTGRFDGAVWCANNAYISGSPQHHFLSGANGRFVVDQNGNLTCQYAVINGGDFKGVVSVEQLRGDVYRKGYYSQRVIERRILDGNRNEEREFFRANIGAQPFSQRLVLSNVNAPVQMYDGYGSADFYWQIEGQTPVWYSKIDGPAGSRIPDLMNFITNIPANATWIRFFCVTGNKTTWGRTNEIPGVIETMKAEQVGMSVTTN
ncbi:DUF1983 domain-containing protein [Aeromonas dhakensis]|uniref:phage tail tip fiber protein n=1 Tax=Aeromonas dhakensis TaxID=196024 RepID=UPI00191F00B6|nr:DUF1983 domain-containing protein [Aeromonas dhakensis]MBL0525235.1 DUF1983 domain-containing protein [Aeromonas dhakensis]